MSDDIVKLVGVGLLSAGAGGAGVHTLGDGEAVADPITIEHCQVFIDHATRHADDECDLRVLSVKVDN